MRSTKRGKKTTWTAEQLSSFLQYVADNRYLTPWLFLATALGVATGAVAAVLLWAGGLAGLQTLVIIVAGPFMLVLIGMCWSLLKSLREETFESTLPSRVRRAVEHAQKYPDGP